MHCFGFPKDGADLQEKRTLWEGVKREEKFFHWGCTDNGAMRHAGSWTMGLYASSSPFLSLISLPPHPLFCIYSILLFYEFIVIFCNFSEFILIFGEFFGFCWCEVVGSAYQSIPNGAASGDLPSLSYKIITNGTFRKVMQKSYFIKEIKYIC